MYAAPELNNDLSDQLEQITRFTLTSIERRSLGGFRRTIPRVELERKLDAFLASETPIFPLIAPGGFGKSIALAHWVRTIKRTHYCLFCGAGMFLTMLEEGGMTRDQPRLKLDDPGNIFHGIRTLPTREQPSLVVVIDALDEISNDPKRMLRLVDYLFEASGACHGEAKFVFSIKEATWRTYLQERFESATAAAYAEQVGPLPETGYTNIAPLSNSEIRKIIANDNGTGDQPFIFECISWDIRELLRIPIQLYLVSRLFETIPSLEHLSRTDVIREYLSEFLFRSNYAGEKENIVWKILGMMEEKGEYLRVNKKELKMQSLVNRKREAANYQAYHELLHDGILIEEREENANGIFVTRTGFRHQNFFVYLYALYLIREAGALSFSLISGIAKQKENEAWINDLIATLYQVAYDAENLEALKDFCTLPRRILSSLSVRLTVGASFRKDTATREELVALYAASEAGRRYFFESYVDTNFLFNNYVMRTREYQQHNKGKEAVLFTNAIFYLAAFMKMDAEACCRYAALMEAAEPDASVYPWPIGRKVFSHLLQTVFVEGKADSDFRTYLETHTNIAYSYPGYLERGLIEFEMYIMLAMVMIRDFEGLERLLSHVVLRYGVMNTAHSSAANLHRVQNAIPLYFLEYAIYKLDYNSSGRPDVLWDKAIDRYATNYDDYQYLILLNWFLVDYLLYNKQPADALKYYDAALHIARIAGYDFYEAFLLVNDPLKDEERMRKGEAMIAASGFAREMFTFPIGPCA